MIGWLNDQGWAEALEKISSKRLYVMYPSRRLIIMFVDVFKSEDHFPRTVKLSNQKWHLF